MSNRIYEDTIILANTMLGTTSPFVGGRLTVAPIQNQEGITMNVPAAVGTAPDGIYINLNGGDVTTSLVGGTTVIMNNSYNAGFIVAAEGNSHNSIGYRYWRKSSLSTNNFAFSIIDSPAGGIINYSVTDTGNIFGQKITINGDASFKLAPQGVVSTDSFFKIAKNIGVANDYIQHIILLHPIYDGVNLITHYECNGKVIKRRGGTNSGLAGDTSYINTASAYNGLMYNSHGDVGPSRLYTFLYNGVRYVGVITNYNTSAVEYSFEGYISGDANQLLIIPYRNSQSGEILNAEVYNSLAEVNYSPTFYNGGLIINNRAGGNLTLTYEGINDWAFGENSGDQTRSFNIYNYNTSSVNLTINQLNGDVSIGNVSSIPNTKLFVAGQTAIGNQNGEIATPTKLVMDTSYNNSTDTGTNLKIYLHPGTGGITNPTYDSYGFGIGNFGDVQYYSTVHRFITSGTEKIRIIADGSLGIGTTAPAAKLHVIGNSEVSGTANSSRLKYHSGFDVGGTDLNFLKSAGFYIGASMTNAPDADWYYITVESHSDNQWVHQTATKYGTSGTLGNIFTRVFNSSIWTAWVELIKTDNIYSFAVPNRNQGNWHDGTVINNVIGMLAWKMHNNGHVIFDASAGTSPSGGAVDSANSSTPWTPSYPALMGWNGAQTFGLRVDSARASDIAGTASNANTLGGIGPAGYVQVNGSGDAAIAGVYYAQGGVGAYDNGIVNGQKAFRIEGYPHGNNYSAGLKFSIFDYDGAAYIYKEAMRLDSYKTMYVQNGIQIGEGNGTGSGYGLKMDYIANGRTSLASLSAGSGYGMFYYQGAAGRDGNDSVEILFGTQTVTDSTMSILTNGNVKIKGSVTASSDLRLKENLRPLENSLAKIQKVSGFKFDRIDNKEKNQIGFVAQDLEKEFPELVLTDKHLYDDGEGLKTVNYQAMTAILLEAIKEQQKQFEDLQEVVTKLKEEVTKLKRNE